MTNGNRELPPGWAWSTFGEIAQVNGRSPKLRDFPNELQVTFVPMAAVDARAGTIAQPEEQPLGKVRKDSRHSPKAM